MKNSEHSSQTDHADQSDLSDLLPDFLNGHLSDADRVRVAVALEGSAQLKEQLEFQRALQVALRSEAQQREEIAAVGQVARGSGFEAIAERIVDSPFERFRRRLFDFWQGGSLTASVPAFAAVLALGVFLANTYVSTETPVNEFETLFGVEQHDEPTLRLLTNLDAQSLELETLLREYGLRIKAVLPESNMIDVVQLTTDADIALVAQALGQDERVLFAKVLNASGANSE